jgi:hypothetical protein
MPRDSSDMDSAHPYLRLVPPSPQVDGDTSRRFSAYFSPPSDPLSYLDFFPCCSFLMPLTRPPDHLPSGVIGNAAAHALHHCAIGEYLTRSCRSPRVPEPSRAEPALPLASTQPCLHRHLRINLHLLLQTPSSNTGISTCPTRLIHGSPRF